MVKIITRKIKKQNYYYLSHSYRVGNSVRHVEKYLGTFLPEIEALGLIKEDFNYEVFEKLWKPQIEETKAEYVKLVNSLPQPIQVKDLRSFGVRFTHNTNKIEGSQLTLKDTALIIEDNISPKDKSITDIVEAKSHMSVYEELIASEREIDWDLILDWHEKIFKVTKPNIAGLIRQYPIQISRSKYVPPMAGVEDLLDELIKWYRENKGRLHPVYLACIVHFRFVSIHPFGDGNGRMCRILMNYILFKNKYPMFDISYEMRHSYYNALERANLKEDEMVFINWLFTRYVKANKKYLKG